LWRVIVTIHELLPDDLVADLEILFEFLLFDEFKARPVDRVKFFSCYEIIVRKVSFKFGNPTKSSQMETSRKDQRLGSLGS
jgi:hypothetical protein